MSKERERVIRIINKLIRMYPVNALFLNAFMGFVDSLNDKTFKQIDDDIKREYV